MQSIDVQKDSFKAHLFKEKNFEVCKEDRGFHVGDLVKLREVNLDETTTGRSIVAVITYISDTKQKNGNVVINTSNIGLGDVDTSLSVKEWLCLLDNHMGKLYEWKD